jgi:hypothetical protein
MKIDELANDSQTLGAIRDEIKGELPTDAQAAASRVAAALKADTSEIQQVIRNAPATLREASEQIRTRFDAVKSDLSAFDDALTKKATTESTSENVTPARTISDRNEGSNAR